ncbi:MAG: cytochrome c3 family protein [Nitrospirae bacterium]|nr:cytochrome c3 family protein [Nitrospirota bacterium]
MKKIVCSCFLIIVMAIFLNVSPKALAADSAGGGGDILYTKPVKSVLFSHRLHVDEKRLSCDMCHANLFAMEALAAQENADFNMDALYKGKYCGACHNGKTAFASNTQCARCHGGVKEYAAAEGKPKPVAKPIQGPKGAIVLGSGDSAVNFVHEAHAKNYRCSECHPKLFAPKKGLDKIAMNDLYQGKYCGTCHNGNASFASTECSKCHAKMTAPKAPLAYKPKDIGPVQFSHQVHTGAFSCDKCHPKLFAMKKTQGKITMDEMNNGKYCGACHNGKVATAVTECDKCHK